MTLWVQEYQGLQIDPDVAEFQKTVLNIVGACKPLPPYVQLQKLYKYVTLNFQEKRLCDPKFAPTPLGALIYKSSSEQAVSQLLILFLVQLGHDARLIQNGPHFMVSVVNNGEFFLLDPAAEEVKNGLIGYKLFMLNQQQTNRLQNNRHQGITYLAKTQQLDLFNQAGGLIAHSDADIQQLACIFCNQYAENSTPLNKTQDLNGECTHEECVVFKYLEAADYEATNKALEKFKEYLILVAIQRQNNYFLQICDGKRAIFENVITCVLKKVECSYCNPRVDVKQVFKGGMKQAVEKKRNYQVLVVDFTTWALMKGQSAGIAHVKQEITELLSPNMMEITDFKAYWEGLYLVSRIEIGIKK